MILFNDFCHRHYTKCLFPNTNPYAIYTGAVISIVDDNGRCFLDLHRCLTKSTTAKSNPTSNTPSSILTSSTQALKGFEGMSFWVRILIAVSTIYIALSLSILYFYKLKAWKKKKNGYFNFVNTAFLSFFRGNGRKCHQNVTYKRICKNKPHRSPIITSLLPHRYQN